MKLNQIMNNFHSVRVGHVVLYFSYETLIAFVDVHDGFGFVAENEWSNTTAKHIGYVKQHNLVQTVPHTELEFKISTII